MTAAFKILEPAIDPNNRISFLLDWELTMKCNLDCSYCESDLYGGHFNKLNHPPLDECLKTIDFMYKYVDLYMATKPKGIRYVILNVYGGEALHHPYIDKILSACREKYNSFAENWHLTITTTTNAIISKSKLEKISPYIDEFTCSYHSEASYKQQQQFKENLLLIKNLGKRLKCVVLMHPEKEKFDYSQAMINWCTENNIRYLPRQLDHDKRTTQFNYNQQQVTWFKSLYQKKTYNFELSIEEKKVGDNYDLADTGRACCGGRQLVVDNNYKSRIFYTKNNFTNWYCSVNEFFLYIKQVTKEIFVNKDCKMNFNEEVKPIGYLDNYQELLTFTENNIANNSMPIIKCKKSRCLCGLCAPKAESLDEFNKIMKKYKK
jgi:pyruvate-formate lyase-activating enzyme